jgi:hypothetical protein
MLLPDIANKLQILGVGTKGTDLFMGTMPDTPDNLVALYEYPGEGRSLAWNSITRESPNLQALVRNKSYDAGRTKIEQIVNALHGLANVTLGTTKYLLINSIQSPGLLQRDSSNRAIFVVNFSVNKEVG